MLVALTSVFFLQPLPSPPAATPDVMVAPTTAPVALPAPKTNVAKACASIVGDVKDKLVPNLKAYKALSDEIVDKLQFVDGIEPIVSKIDVLRNSTVGRAVVSSVAGAGWVTTAWDKLRSLTTTVNSARAELEKVRVTAADLLKATERFAAEPDDAQLTALLLGYDGAAPKFASGVRAFGDLDRILDGVIMALRGARDTLTSMKDVPVIGEDFGGLADQCDGLARKMSIAKQVIKLTVDAIGRDKTDLEKLRQVLYEARAHDGFDVGEQLRAAGRPGSAMQAFRDVSQRWPDTQWAHRADRRIADTVAYVDGLEPTIARLQKDVADLHVVVASARAPIAVDTLPVESGRADADPRAPVTNVPAASSPTVVPVTSASSNLLPLVLLAMTAIALAITALSAWRRRARGSR